MSFWPPLLTARASSSTPALCTSRNLAPRNLRSTLSSVVAGDGWVEIPDNREGIPTGETVEVQQ
nr:hypothetical protein [Halovenus rubra]